MWCLDMKRRIGLVPDFFCSFADTVALMLQSLASAQCLMFQGFLEDLWS